MSPPANTDPISPSLVDKVLEQAQDTASHSWEYGVVFEALLEYHNPSLTVFHTPVAQQKQPLVNQESDVAALDYIKQRIRTDSSTLCEGNGSSSDPSSLGIPALLLSHSSPDSSHYLSAAQRQLTTLLTSTPRLDNGAISHRTAIASAWSDFVYMAPPFLAYYGVYTDDEQLVRESVRQCRLYSEILATESGLWKHIVSASDEKKGPGERKDDDVGFWSTGNGWAAAGMARVLATIRQSKLAEQMQKEQKVLVEMIGGIVRGAMATDTDPSLLLRNYLGDETWWGEVAGTALLAAATFRMVVLEPGMFGRGYTDWALQKMIAVRRHINTETGIAAPVVNALIESQRTPLDGVNPESQAFVVLMYAAWRDWKTQNA